MPLIGKLKQEEESKKGKKQHKKKSNESLPPDWIEIKSPAGEVFFFNTKTWMTQVKKPKMTISDLPLSDTVFPEKLSPLKAFQRAPPDFYEPLAESYKSAGFKNYEKIKEESQEKVKGLKAKGGLDKYKLSDEEAEVISSYTYQAGKSNEAPYYVMNKAISERNDNNLRACRGYILHLLKALRKLKPVPTKGRRLYRGIDGDSPNFDKNRYKPGNVLTWPAFTSTSLREDAIRDQFLKRASKPVIFEITGDFVGYNIKDFSNYPDEDEVLLEPETTFKVIFAEDDKNNLEPRIIVRVQKTPLMIKETVENFARAEQKYRQSQDQAPPQKRMRIEQASDNQQPTQQLFNGNNSSDTNQQTFNPQPPPPTLPPQQVTFGGNNQQTNNSQPPPQQVTFGGNNQYQTQPPPPPPQQITFGGNNQYQTQPPPPPPQQVTFGRNNQCQQQLSPPTLPQQGFFCGSNQLQPQPPQHQQFQGAQLQQQPQYQQFQQGPPPPQQPYPQQYQQYQQGPPPPQQQGQGLGQGLLNMAINGIKSLSSFFNSLKRKREDN